MLMQECYEEIEGLRNLQSLLRRRCHVSFRNIVGRGRCDGGSTLVRYRQLLFGEQPMAECS